MNNRNQGGYSSSQGGQGSNQGGYSSSQYNGTGGGYQSSQQSYGHSHPYTQQVTHSHYQHHTLFGTPHYHQVNQPAHYDPDILCCKIL